MMKIANVQSFGKKGSGTKIMSTNDFHYALGAYVSNFSSFKGKKLKNRKNFLRKSNVRRKYTVLCKRIIKFKSNLSERQTDIDRD